MEKNTPHCKLSIAQALVTRGHIRFTQGAVDGADELGFDRQGITEVVLSLKKSDFYKAMTTHADHRVWQDVYRPMTVAGEVYLKLTVIDDVLVVSFKEL
jgi:motility quorum-sensing regulator/GCU-specific mRNA interferase toxin